MIVALKSQKKKKEIFCFTFQVYGRFLLSMSIIAAPIMTITMIIATIPYITVVFDANPVSGVAAGAAVAAGELA